MPKPIENMDVHEGLETGYTGLGEIGLNDTIFETINDNASFFNMSFNPPLVPKERYHQACCDTLYKEHCDISTIFIDLTLASFKNVAEPRLTLADDISQAVSEMPTPKSCLQESHPSKTPPLPFHNPSSPTRPTCGPAPPTTPPKKIGHQPRNSSRGNSPHRPQHGECGRENPHVGSESRITKKYKNPLTASLKQFTRELIEGPDALKNGLCITQEAMPVKRMSYVKLLEKESKSFALRI